MSSLATTWPVGRYPTGGLGSSGCAEVGGDDGVVTLGSFSSERSLATPAVWARTDEQAGTFMHEFGHLLGFRHGGDDAVNCKPNYRSVMNYNRQFSGSPILGRRLDYSRSEDLTLTESSLIEGAGIGGDLEPRSHPPVLPLGGPDRLRPWRMGLFCDRRSVHQLEPELRPTRGCRSRTRPPSR